METNTLADTDNFMWHHLVLTTKGHGKGMNMYIDGQLEAASPRGLNCAKEAGGCIGRYRSGVDDGHHANGFGGDPMDPVGDLRLCGRQIGGAITNDLDHTGDADAAEYDPRRYFHGQVAHFAVWDSPLTQHQVNALLEEYRRVYNMPSGSEQPSDTAWEDKASLSGALLAFQGHSLLTNAHCVLTSPPLIYPAHRMDSSGPNTPKNVQPRRPPWAAGGSRRREGRLLR